MKVQLVFIPVAQILFLSVLLLLNQTHATQITFKGKESIVCNLRSSPIAIEHNQITFRFKTIHPDGMILFSRGTQGDYISIDLIQGKLRYKIDLGKTFQSRESVQQAIVGSNLANNRWHTVHINRRGTITNISVDEFRSSASQSGGMFKRLDLDRELYIGGKIGTGKGPSDLGLITKNYIGCLENFIMDDTDILYNVKHNAKNYRAIGDLYYGCDAIDYDPVTFPNPQAVANIPSDLEKSLEARFKFRTHLPHGLILSKISSSGTIYLGIRYSKLFVKVIAPKMTPIELQLGQNMNDGTWHDVRLFVTRTKVLAVVDDEFPVTHSGIWLKNIKYTSGVITIGGGAEHLYTGFVGCIHELFLDGTNVDFRLLRKEYIQGALLRKCKIRDLCWPNPCKNQGKCSQNWKSFQCDCRQTMYNDKICDNPIVQRNCEDYKYLGLKEDSYCVIDPDGKGKLEPIEVLCNVTGGKRAKTVMPLKDKNGLIQVNVTPTVSNKYFHLIRYTVNMQSLERVVKNSTSCRQHVSYLCKSTPLLNSPRGPPLVEWVNRKGIIETYWGGAVKGSEKCACGMNKTCADKRKYCNCDIGDNVWREDSGYIRDQNALPVNMLQFDASVGGAYYSIGNLECTAEVSMNKSEEKYVAALRACRPVYSVSTTKIPTYTQVSTTLQTIQKEVTLTNNERSTTAYNTREFEKPTLKTPKFNKGGKKGNANVNVNVTVGIKDKDTGIENDNNGLTISMSMLALIVISATIVVVMVIIAVIVIVRRKRASQGRSSRSRGGDDDDINETEMCVLFRASERRVDKPTMEIRRHSFRTDSTDTFPDIGLRGFHQPITTHIDLNYQARKKSGGFFC